MPKGRKKGPQKAWYVLAVDIGMDSRVKKDLQKTAKLHNLKKQVGKIVVCRHPEQVWINDVEQTHMKMSFPGYLIVHCKFTDDVFHLIGSIQGAQGFLMDPHNPIPLSNEEEARVFIKREIMKKEPCQIEQTPVERKYKVGDKVKVTEGAWTGQDGTVEENLLQNRVMVKIQFVGKETLIVIPEPHLEKA